MYEWIKLSNAVKYVGIEVHPSSRRRVYLKTRPVADVRCQPLLHAGPCVTSEATYTAMRTSEFWNDEITGLSL